MPPPKSGCIWITLKSISHTSELIKLAYIISCLWFATELATWYLWTSVIWMGSSIYKQWMLYEFTIQFLSDYLIILDPIYIKNNKIAYKYLIHTWSSWLNTCIKLFAYSQPSIDCTSVHVYRTQSCQKNLNLMRIWIFTYLFSCLRRIRYPSIIS